MSTFVGSAVGALKKDTVSNGVPGAVGGLLTAFYTFNLTTKNSVSIMARVRELFNALRDGNHISHGTEGVNIYATQDINGGPIAIGESFIGMSNGQVRVGIGSDVREIGSGILERHVLETLAWANENNRLVNG